MASSPKTTDCGLTADKGGIGPGNSVADSLRKQNHLSQQLQPTTIAQPTEKKKCLAVVEVEQKNKPTICLKYAFFVTEAEPFSASGDEHCNPTVEQMMRTLLPNRLAMPMVQLTKMFGLQLQYLDNEFEPAEFIDIDPHEWGVERVKDRGEYKVLLHRKLDNNNAGGIEENGRPTGKKKCLAVVEVEQKNKLTICLKYAFFVTEAEPFSASGYEHEHCNPMVEQMMRTLLPNRLSMSMEQLTKMFGLQLQYLDNEFEPAEFIDIDPREWCAERVKNRGKYKVLLHLDGNNDRTAMNQLNDARQMNDNGILNILLLGEIGVGKSTLVNAVVNYLKHLTFDDAIKADEIEWAKPAKFNMEEYNDDGELVQTEVVINQTTYWEFSIL